MAGFVERRMCLAVKGSTGSAVPPEVAQERLQLGPIVVPNPILSELL